MRERQQTAECLFLNECVWIIWTLCACRHAKRVKIVIIKIEPQINHLHTQLYSNDAPKAEKHDKRTVWSFPFLYTPIALYKTKQPSQAKNRPQFLCVDFNDLLLKQQK